MNENQTVFRRAHNRENPYAQIARATLQDKRLSWKARGLLSYLLSKPDDWIILFSHLVNEAPDGKASLQTAIKELQRHGYLEKRMIRDEKGRIVRWENLIHEFSIVEENPETDFRDLGIREMDKRDLDNLPLHNKEITKERSKQNRERQNNEDAVVVSEINDVIEEIEKSLECSIASLLPMIPKWIEELGATFLKERAVYVSTFANRNRIGAFRNSIEHRWEIGKDNKTSNTVQDERYANFYKLFPNEQ